MSDTTNYQCPACNGPLHFDSATQMLKCDYCDSTFTVEEIEGKKTTEVKEDNWWQNENVSDELAVYRCSSCGAELVVDKNEAASTCPYCNNPVVMEKNLTGAVKPDFVLPYKINKDQAIEILHQHYSKKKLLPKSFREENHIKEIKGMYVPYWLFNGTCSGSAEFEATRVMRHTTHDEEITTTEYYRAERSGSVDFKRVPVDASSKMPDDYMNAIEPFDYASIKPFTMAYLAGYCADKFDEGVADCAERADKRAINSTVDILRNSVEGYTTVTEIHNHLIMNRKDAEYALLPVWILSSEFMDKNYLFIINGQTGKVSGEFPMDKSLYNIEFIKTLGIVAVIVGAICTWLFG